jgi:hypothetical protein
VKRIAILPMYDFPELQEAHDALWAALSLRMIAAGVDETPLQLRSLGKRDQIFRIRRVQRIAPHKRGHGGRRRSGCGRRGLRQSCTFLPALSVGRREIARDALPIRTGVRVLNAKLRTSFIITAIEEADAVMVDAL